MASTYAGVAGFVVALIALATPSSASAAETAYRHGDYAKVNGLQLYYETAGPTHGVPLVLLHGGGSTIDVTFGRILPVLARSRRVIAIEEQAHGRSGDRDAPLTFATSADDVAALLDQLKIARADLFGFSNGASTGLEVAIRHSGRVRKLVFASAFTKRAGAQPQLWNFMDRADISNMPPFLKDAFLAVNPDPARLKVMHDKDAERMRHFVDVPDDELRSIRTPTLVLAGDHDVVLPEHAVALTHLIPDSRLTILAGGHGDYFGVAPVTSLSNRAAERTAALIEDFLDAP